MTHFRTKLKTVSAVILCGGLGKRLRPVTGKAMPKALASINGIPFLDILLQHMARQGLKHVVLCTGYQSKKIEKHYQQNNFGLHLQFSSEKRPLGTGGAVKNAKAKIKSSSFFVLNGDCFCSISLQDFFDFHQRKKATASLVLSKIKDKKDYGCVTVKPSAEVTAFEEKATRPKSSYVSTGIYCFERKIFDLMPEENVFSIEKDFFPSLIGKNFYGFMTDHFFLDIGTPKRYQIAQKQLKYS